LGDNALGQVVYNRTTGGCYDGLGKNLIKGMNPKASFGNIIPQQAAGN